MPDGGRTEDMSRGGRPKTIFPNQKGKTTECHWGGKANSTPLARFLPFFSSVTCKKKPETHSLRKHNRHTSNRKAERERKMKRSEGKKK